jgi:hypothetical protein
MMAIQSRKLRFVIAFATMLWALAGLLLMLLLHNQVITSTTVELAAPVVAVSGIGAFFWATRRKLNS